MKSTNIKLGGKKLPVPELEAGVSSEVTSILPFQEHADKIIPNKQVCLGKSSNMMKVYQGHFNKKLAAVKIINFEGRPPPQALLEIKKLTELSPNKNIIRYHGVHETPEGSVLIAMEQIKMTLASWVRIKNSNFSRVEILRQITSGLEYLHSSGIVHGGVKPTNIFLKQVGKRGLVVKLSDYGLTRDVKRNWFTHNPAAWTAPEILDHDTKTRSKPAKVADSSDIFPLGCIFYYVLSGGNHPFTNDRNRQSFYIVENQPFKESIKLQDTHFGNILLIKSMINPNPTERPSCSLILSHPFFWSDIEIVQFFNTAEQLYKYNQSDKYQKCTDNLESLSALLVIQNKTWIELLCPYMSRFAEQLKANHSMSSLLNTIARIALIYKVLPKMAKVFLGSTTQDFVRYWLDRFPFLVNFMWLDLRCPEVNFQFDLENTEKLLQDYFETTGKHILIKAAQISVPKHPINKLQDAADIEKTDNVLTAPPDEQQGIRAKGLFPKLSSKESGTSQESANPLPSQVSSEQEPPFKSQYLSEFIPLECLGQGGFGVVFKAQKEIDDRIYAVKRISLPKRERERERVMREVKALAKLEHRNIVRYFNAWMESPPEGWLALNDPLWTETQSSSTYSYYEEAGSTTSSKGKTVNEQTDESEPLPLAYLYIQQELCQKETLQDWLRSQKTIESTLTSDIFSQILNAVEYFHSQNFIHRDLKPSNIFFAEDTGQKLLTVKIGDFGLVRDAYSGNVGASCPNLEHVQLTSRVGTRLYMSPEQYNKKPYDHKVDIYSLGLIFFELLVLFSTDMERIPSLTDVRNGIFSKDFIAKFPEQFKIIKTMVSHNPTQRPDADQIQNQIRLLTNREGLIRVLGGVGGTRISVTINTRENPDNEKDRVKTY